MGAEVNQKDDSGRTAIHWAARGHGSRQMIKFLVEKGANVRGRDSERSTALH